MFGLKVFLVAVSTFLLHLFSHPTISTKYNITKKNTPSPSSAVIAPTSTGFFNATMTPEKSVHGTSTTQVSQFIYPNASVISSNDTSLTLSISDDSNTIFTWYKNILQSGNGSLAISTVNANGTIDDKLSGNLGSIKVDIHIHKDAQATSTTINVNISAQSGQNAIQNNIYNSTNTY